MFLLNNNLGVLQNKHSSNWYIALVGISLQMVFLYKFELAKNAPKSVNTHLKLEIVTDEVTRAWLINHQPTIKHTQPWIFSTCFFQKG